MLGQMRATIKDADALFDKKSYIKAASIYERLPHDQHVLSNLGDCYFYNSMMLDAVRVYGELFTDFSENLDKEYYYRYAHALLGVNSIDKADQMMSIYRNSAVNTHKFSNTLTDIVPDHYQVKLMSDNTTNGDFGIGFYGEQVVFASTRNTKSPTYYWNGKPYLDLYFGDVLENGEIHNIQAFPKEINTDTHESSAVFSADYKTMYFNRTSEKREKVGSEKFASVKIMRASLINDKWQNIIELPFCSNSYSTLHPFLTKDGKRLYFSSDMPGSLGSFDIFYVQVNDDGTFGLPQNAGSTINTIHREQFPYLSSEDSVLYFSSDGHQGFGGLDVFRSKFENNEFAKPQNLGSKINSNLDDFAYIVDEVSNRGYLSSNRNGSDNLYSFDRVKKELIYSVEGVVRDKKSKLLLPGTTIIISANGLQVDEVTAGPLGEFYFKVQPDTRYVLRGSRNFYIPHIIEFEMKSDGELKYSFEMLMEAYKDAEDFIFERADEKFEVVLENIYFNVDKSNILPKAAKTLDVLVALMKKYPSMEIEMGAHTDSQGNDIYNFKLSQRRAASTLEYLVSKGIERKRLIPVGFGESVLKVNCGDKCTAEEHAKNRRCEFIILK